MTNVMTLTYQSDINFPFLSGNMETLYTGPALDTKAT